MDPSNDVDTAEIDAQILRAYIADSTTVKLRTLWGEVQIWTDDRPEWREL